jgi:hypothetical protein
MQVAGKTSHREHLPSLFIEIESQHEVSNFHRGNKLSSGGHLYLERGLHHFRL